MNSKAQDLITLFLGSNQQFTLMLPQVEKDNWYQTDSPGLLIHPTHHIPSQWPSCCSPGQLSELLIREAQTDFLVSFPEIWWPPGSISLVHNPLYTHNLYKLFVTMILVYIYISYSSLDSLFGSNPFLLYISSYWLPPLRPRQG